MIELDADRLREDARAYVTQILDDLHRECPGGVSDQELAGRLLGLISVEHALGLQMLEKIAALEGKIQ